MEIFLQIFLDISYNCFKIYWTRNLRRVKFKIKTQNTKKIVFKAVITEVKMLIVIDVESNDFLPKS